MAPLGQSRQKVLIFFLFVFIQVLLLALYLEEEKIVTTTAFSFFFFFTQNNYNNVEKPLIEFKIDLDIYSTRYGGKKLHIVIKKRRHVISIIDRK